MVRLLSVAFGLCSTLALACSSSEGVIASHPETGGTGGQGASSAGATPGLGASGAAGASGVPVANCGSAGSSSGASGAAGPSAGTTSVGTGQGGADAGASDGASAAGLSGNGGSGSNLAGSGSSADWPILWSDEFNSANGSTPDASNWRAEDVFNGNNNELEYYTSRPSNVTVTAGNLVLTGRAEQYSAKGVTAQYTSGRVTSKAIRSFAPEPQRALRIEARIRPPTGQGYWPAFWMVGDDVDTSGWPACGEIDIMEISAATPHASGSTTHYLLRNTHAYKTWGVATDSSDLSQDFHVYAVQWDVSGNMQFFFDGMPFGDPAHDLSQNQSFVGGKRFFFYLNVAIGGTLGGDAAAGTYPKSMLVDWVRVRQQPSPN